MLNSQILVLIRGIPGSGKTYLGTHLASELSGFHLEDYWKLNEEGRPARQRGTDTAARAHVIQLTEQMLYSRTQLLIVSNNFCAQKELLPFKRLAQKYHCYTIVIDLTLNAFRSYIFNPKNKSTFQGVKKARSKMLEQYLRTGLCGYSLTDVAALLDEYELCTAVVQCIEANHRNVIPNNRTSEFGVQQAKNASPRLFHCLPHMLLLLLQLLLLLLLLLLLPLLLLLLLL